MEREDSAAAGATVDEMDQDTLTAVVDAGIYFEAEEDPERIGSYSSSSSLGKRGRDDDDYNEAVHSGAHEASEAPQSVDTAKGGELPPYSYELMKWCFLTLHRYETPSHASLSLPTFRNEVASQLPPDSAIAIHTISDDILQIVIDDYLITVQQKEKRLITSSILKYSRRETEIILGAVRAYMKDYSLSLEDVCPSLRPDSDHLKGTKKDLIRRLFDELHRMLPYRQRDTIKFFVERKLFLSIQPLRGRWTEEEKGRLLALYEKYGPKWAKLGRELHKRHEDVRWVSNMFIP